MVSIHELMNRKTLSIRLCLSVALLLLYTAAGAAEWKKVRWVDDGDTVVLSDGTKVRYIGINAPEVAHEERRAERFGPEATAFNRKLVHGKKVRLALDRERRDQYGRLLAYLFLEDGRFVNGELVKNGFAYFVFRRPNNKYDEILLRLQRQAMEKRAGLWKDLPDKGGPWVGNRNSRRFHRPDCPFGKAMAAKNRILFEQQYDAFWAGYSPCKKCLKR
jgi:micrococcal nuclease